MKYKVTRRFYDLLLKKYVFPDEIIDIKFKHYVKYKKYLVELVEVIEVKKKPKKKKGD